MTHQPCSRRLFLIATASTFAGAVLAACGSNKQTINASNVPVGSATLVGDFIIAQPSSGVFHAYSARCPHQGSKISVVEGNKVICTNHNSVFDISDGHPISGPSRAGLTTAKLSAHGEELSVE